MRLHLRLATVALALLLACPVLLAREPIAVLETKVKEIRAHPGNGRWQEFSEVTRELSQARQELSAAIARGSLSELRRELAAGLDTSLPDNQPILSTAVCKHQLPAVRLLVRSGWRANMGSDLWKCVIKIDDPALTWAVLEVGPPWGWQLEAAKEVIRIGALELFKLNDQAAILRAAELGHPGLARQIVAGSRDPASVFRGSLRQALLQGDAAVAQTLLELDADASWLTAKEKNSLLEEVVNFDETAGVGMLLEFGAEPTRQALERAADKDRPEVLRALVAGGADPWLAMAVSLRKEAEASLEALLQDTVYTARGTWIQEVGPEQRARDLLEGGLDPGHHPFLTAGGHFDVEGRDEEGRSGLLRAAEKGDLPLARLYLAAGIDPNGRDRRGRTALLVAARRQDVALMIELRKAGGSDELLTDKGLSPAEAFWAGYRPSRYTNLDPKGTRLEFTLPSSFFTSCQGSDDGAGGFHVECSGGHVMKVVMLARRASGLAAVRAVLAPARLARKEAEQREEVSGATRCSVTGRKGLLELQVTAMGPDGLAPELRRLASNTWHSVSSPLTSAPYLKSVQNVFYLVLLAVLVVGLVVLRLRWRAVARGS